MNTQFPKNKHSEENKKTVQVDASLKELIVEAEKLFGLLDTYTSRIRFLEKELQRVHLNLLFTLKVKKDKGSLLKPALDIHNEGCAGQVHGFWTQDIWYLSWEEDENSKTFRLLLTMKETEFVLFDYGEHIEQVREFSSQIKFRKPLIETNIQLRLQYSEYLISFIDSFKNYLKTYQTAIEQNDTSYDISF